MVRRCRARLVSDFRSFAVMTRVRIPGGVTFLFVSGSAIALVARLVW